VNADGILLKTVKELFMTNLKKYPSKKRQAVFSKKKEQRQNDVISLLDNGGVKYLRKEKTPFEVSLEELRRLLGSLPLPKKSSVRELAEKYCSLTEEQIVSLYGGSYLEAINAIALIKRDLFLISRKEKEHRREKRFSPLVVTLKK